MPRFVDAFRNTLTGKSGKDKEEAKGREESGAKGSEERMRRDHDGEGRSRSYERQHHEERGRHAEEEAYSSEDEEELGQCSLKVFQRSDFQVGGMIGQGSFATVHKAKQLATSRDVALKVVRPESELDFGTGPNGSTPAVSYKDVLKAMRQEVLLMEMIGAHPNVVEVLGTAEECRVFVMERAASDLYTIVKQQERNLPLQLAKLWAGHMLSAIHHMHQNGVVHQDIKSSNVLIFSDRSAKICDFGLARKGKMSMSVDRELVTLWYRPPELLMGESSYSPKVDEWGVGCILLEMMIGSSPFKGKPDCVCQCPQITHRNYNSDQLMKIFAVVGTPKDRALLSRMACAQHFTKWPVFPRKLDSTVKRMCTSERLWRGKGTMPGEKEVEEKAQAWLNIIAGLLNLDYKERWSAHHGLESSLFGSRRTSPTHGAKETPAGGEPPPMHSPTAKAHSGERRPSSELPADKHHAEGGGDAAKDATHARAVGATSS